MLCSVRDISSSEKAGQFSSLWQVRVWLAFSKEVVGVWKRSHRGWVFIELHGQESVQWKFLDSATQKKRAEPDCAKPRQITTAQTLFTHATVSTPQTDNLSTYYYCRVIPVQCHRQLRTTIARFRCETSAGLIAITNWRPVNNSNQARMTSKSRHKHWLNTSARQMPCLIMVSCRIALWACSLYDANLVLLL